MTATFQSHNIHSYLMDTCSCSTMPYNIIHVWITIPYGRYFHRKSEKAFKINFCGFKFCDSNQSRGMALLHKRWCNWYTRSRSSFVTVGINFHGWENFMTTKSIMHENNENYIAPHENYPPYGSSTHIHGNLPIVDNNYERLWLTL